ncbi:dihydroxy-acid dehydratase [uncultured Victivallis sp.]|uniref:dihydroxy-acid dehydratase n=1 Tax=uncultured Victivallis sp. TaxID=354118 RepID=UPI0025E0A4CB|nr:dihydroxy-acid dehydratase [uncultured Victivallis sp.]
MKEMRSALPYGVAGECRRGLIRGMGYTQEEFQRPIVAVVNSWNEYNPGHLHLRTLAERVKQGIREAGGLPFEVMTSAVCDGMVLKNPRYIELPSRNLIADEVELIVESNMFDAMVLLSTCDSIVPGHLMAAARLDIPTIMVTGGYMPMPLFEGRSVNYIELTDHVGKAMKGEYDRTQAEREVAGMYSPCGACGVMTTANSMCFAAEALGMTLPGNGCMAATGSELLQTAYRAGLRIMELLRENITARRILTAGAIENAIALTMATAGSTNLIMHLPAIAREAGLTGKFWSSFDRASREIPQIVAASPSGPCHLQEVDRAGGTRAILRTLMPKLHGEALTVTGRTLAENYADSPIYDPEVIRPLDRPVRQDGSLYVLYGSLAPDGAIIKAGACDIRTFTGRARCFDSLDSALAALNSGEIRPGDVAVLRYLGPRAAFGTTAYVFQKELKGRGLDRDVAIVTDGRFSGGSSGLSIGYLSPEAALGGPLALVHDGDRIEIDLEERKLELCVPQSELEERKRTWSWQFDPSGVPPFLRLFCRNAGSLAEGAAWEC